MKELILKKQSPAPEALVMGGKINFGTFDAPPRKVNLMDADVFGALAPRAFKRFRFKQWQFWLITHERYAIGMLVIDLGGGLIPGSFLYVYDRESKTYFEHKRMGPGCKVALARDIYDGRCKFGAKGYSIEIRNNLAAGRHEISVDMAAEGKSPAVKAEFEILQPPHERPLVVSLPVGGARGMYSHKTACSARGTARIGGEEITLDAARDFALLDEHKAFYPHHFYWKWACLGFRDEKGGLIGANFTDNLIKDQRSWNENCIWSPDGITLLGPVKFDLDMSDMMKPWRIRDEDGLVDVEFTPRGAKLDNTNALVFRMDYRQPFGEFKGRLTTGAGVTHDVKNAFGVTEYYDAWL